MTRARLRAPHPSTDLRVVYWREDPLRRELERLRALRGEDALSDGESEAFAATAYALSRSRLGINRLAG